MTTIELDEEELQVLAEMVDIRISDLRDEIHCTVNYEYREMLKKRREVMLKLKKALEEHLTTSP